MKLFEILLIIGLCPVVMTHAYAMSKPEDKASESTKPNDQRLSRGRKKNIRLFNHLEFDESDQSLKDRILKRLRCSTFWRGARHVAEVASMPTAVASLSVCKDVMLCFCAAGSFVTCAVAGGVIVFTLADLGLSAYDIWDNTVIVGQEQE